MKKIFLKIFISVFVVFCFSFILETQTAFGIVCTDNATLVGDWYDYVPAITYPAKTYDNYNHYTNTGTSKWNGSSYFKLDTYATTGLHNTDALHLGVVTTLPGASGDHHDWMTTSNSVGVQTWTGRMYRIGGTPVDASGVACTAPLPVPGWFGGTTVISTTVIPYTVTGTAGAGGTISPASQSVNTSGSNAILTLSPNSGYTGSASGCGGSLVGNTYTTGPITANCTVTATFSVTSYPITWTAVNGSATPTTCIFGETVTPVCTPNTGYSTASCPAAFTCSTSNLKTATFSINTYTITVNTAGSGFGTVTGAGTYDYNTVISIGANPFTNSTFAGWSGDADCTDGSVTVNANKTCTATFTYSLAPNSPTISGVISGYLNTNYSYSFVAIDPGSYQVRYGIDWSMPADGVADEWLPTAVTYVNSGVPQSVNHSWNSIGAKTFRAYTRNSQGIDSAWSSLYNVSISEAPIVGVCGTASKTYPAGSTSF